jgi:DNA-binding NarL/FixJ family response regulator
MSPITFLIVDDFQASREHLRELIESATPWQVVGEAKDGQEAIRKARQLRPNIIILDVSMPGINGIQAAKIIKDHLPKTHIIMYSSYNIPLIAQRALTAGADAYFNKNELERTPLVALIQQWYPTPHLTTFPITPSQQEAFS